MRRPAALFLTVCLLIFGNISARAHQSAPPAPQVTQSELIMPLNGTLFFCDVINDGEVQGINSMEMLDYHITSFSDPAILKVFEVNEWAVESTGKPGTCTVTLTHSENPSMSFDIEITVADVDVNDIAREFSNSLDGVIYVGQKRSAQLKEGLPFKDYSFIPLDYDGYDDRDFDSFSTSYDESTGTFTVEALKTGKANYSFRHKHYTSGWGFALIAVEKPSADAIEVNPDGLQLPQGISTSLEQIINAGIVTGINADEWKSYNVTAPEGQDAVTLRWLDWSEAYEIAGLNEGETELHFVHKEFEDVAFDLKVRVVKGLAPQIKETFSGRTIYVGMSQTLKADSDIDINDYYLDVSPDDHPSYSGKITFEKDPEANAIIVTGVTAGKAQLLFGHKTYSASVDGCIINVQEQSTEPTVPTVVEGKVERLMVNYGSIVEYLVRNGYITGIAPEELYEQYNVESSDESVLEIVARGEAFEGRAIGEAELVFTHKTFPDITFSVPVHVVECTVKADKDELEYGESVTLEFMVSDGFECDNVEWKIEGGDNDRYVTIEGNRLTYSSPRLSFLDGQVYVVGHFDGSLSAGKWIRLKTTDTGYQFTDRYPFIYVGNSLQLALALTETIEGITIPAHTFRLADEEDSEFLIVSPNGMATALKYPYEHRVIPVEAVDANGDVLCTTEVTIFENITHAPAIVKGRIDLIRYQFAGIEKILADYFGQENVSSSDYELTADNPDILWIDEAWIVGQQYGSTILTITPKGNRGAAVNIEVTVNESRDFTFSTLEYKYNSDFKRWAYHIKAGETATAALESNLPVGENWTIEMESGHIGLLDVTKLPGNMIEFKAAENRGGYNLFLIKSDDYCNSYGEIYVISYVEEEKPVEMASTEAEVAAGLGVKIPVTLPEEVRGTEVTWSSDNEDVAEVHHHTGVVTTKAFGTATITAHAVETVQGVSLLSRAGEEPVATVTVKVGEIGSFAVPAEMEAGEYGNASFTLNPANFGKDGCRWISSRPEIASIDAATGRIHAIAPGTTLIQLTTPVGSRQQVLTVAASDNLPALTLNATDRSVRVGDVFQLIANMEGVTWSSSDRKVAVVDAIGLVIVTGHGSAVITAKTADGRTASCRVSTSVVVVGIEDVVAGAEEAVKPVYDLQGRRVARDASELGSLRPGIYIVGGRKVLVR